VVTGALGLLRASQGKQAKPRPVWSGRPFQENVAVVVAENAVLVAGTDRRFRRPEAPPDETHGITALNLEDGKPLWKHPLPAAPVAWGMAIDRKGRVLVALQDGGVVCFGPEG